MITDADVLIHLIHVNGAPRNVAPGTTVADLLALLGVPAQGTAVEKGGAIVARERHAQTPLEAGDTLEIVRLVGGG